MVCIFTILLFSGSLLYCLNYCLVIPKTPEALEEIERRKRMEEESKSKAEDLRRNRGGGGGWWRRKENGGRRGTRGERRRTENGRRKEREEWRRNRNGGKQERREVERREVEGERGGEGDCGGRVGGECYESKLYYEIKMHYVFQDVRFILTKGGHVEEEGKLRESGAGEERNNDSYVSTTITLVLLLFSVYIALHL